MTVIILLAFMIVSVIVQLIVRGCQGSWTSLRHGWLSIR